MPKPVKRYREVMTITMPPEVIERAKAAAKDRGISASKFIELAVFRLIQETNRRKRNKERSEEPT